VSTVRQATICYFGGVWAPTMSETSSCLHFLQQPSPTLNHKTLANHPCWISYIIMSSPLPEKFIWKSNSTARQKTTYWYRKAFCATSIGLFSHLKTFGILILTAHSNFGSFANIDWRKSFLSAFWIFTLTSSTHSFLA